ncbi:transmembrane protein 130 [Trichonephila clavata]|uniref:Transmembrane protein 130 n=2 Tax=Trichonephila TaxID=2585208 RepID=A0A8X6F9U3_TRICU|nr:transmembrane protein 130 [Trichonephila clavata]
MTLLRNFSITALLIVAFEIFKVLSSPVLFITNDGPATLDSSVTFSAVLKNYVPKHELKFVFDDGIQKTEYVVESCNMSMNRPVASNLYKEGFYTMEVSVTTKNFIFKDIIAANSSRFELKRDLIGTIHVYRNNKLLVDVDEVGVGENVSVVVDLIDNSVKDIKAIVTAVFPNADFKYGFFEKTITAKVPVNNVNVSGNPFLYHGDTLNLNVTCNGTPPFVYCYEILKQNASTGNFSCTHLSTFTTCRMEIIKYFQNDGTYQIGIYISNNVQEVKRVIEVMVYSVSVKPTLSTIITPIVCSLLTLVIIAFGISYYVQHRNQLAVEVANFDFQDDSNSYTERTFFENIFDSFSCRSCTCSRMSCDNQGEVEPLM